jgi:hypothetical protein
LFSLGTPDLEGEIKEAVASDGGFKELGKAEAKKERLLNVNKTAGRIHRESGSQVAARLEQTDTETTGRIDEAPDDGWMGWEMGRTEVERRKKEAEGEWNGRQVMMSCRAASKLEAPPRFLLPGGIFLGTPGPSTSGDCA